MYSNIAFAEHIDCPLFSIVEIDMTKNGVFEQTSKYVWLWSVFNFSTCHNPVFLPDYAECAAKPKPIKLEWKTNKCLIKTHSEDIESYPVWGGCIAIVMRTTFTLLDTVNSYLFSWACHCDDSWLFICTFRFLFECSCWYLLPIESNSLSTCLQKN